MAQRHVTRDVPMLDTRARFDVSTLDEEKRTVEVVWTTGAAVLRGGIFTEPYWEELSLDPKHVRMGRLTSGAAPLLNSHRAGSIEDMIGVVDSAWLTPTEGRAKVRFDSGPQGSDAMRRVKEGTLRNLSAGYQPNTFQEVDRSKDKTRGQYRTLLAVDWEPFELSLLPIGADAGAVTRSAGGITNPCVFIEERAMQNPDNPETPIQTTTANQPATPATPVISTETRAQIEQAAARAATQRVLDIQRIGRALNRPADEIAAAAANPDMTLEAFRAAAVDALANAPAAQGGTLDVQRGGMRTMIEAGDDERDKYRRASENWLIQRAGLSTMVRQAAEKRGEKIDLDPGPARGLTLVEMARRCLERAGVRTDGMDVMDMVGRAFTHRSGGNSTSDFAILLENTMHKTLMAAAQTVPDTWRQWCAKGTVTDFRAHNRYRQGGFGILDDVPEGGEYKNIDIADGEKQQISAGTKGRIVALTRQAIINDDMGAFNSTATRLGRAVALTVEVGAFAYLLTNPVLSDGVALFHANHNNLTTGALSVASIEVDRVAMASQLDVGKNELLELKPSILLIPVGLGGEAKVINRSATDTDGGAGKSNKPNKVMGLYDTIVDTARLTGTARYSFADPAIEPVIEVAFLNGNEAPRMEMQQGWRTDGTEWKVSLDVGFAAVGYRGAVKSSGA
jgi:hypothetical protein